MRAIDADELLKQQYKMGFGQMPVVSVDAIKNAPTLTPLNEWVSMEDRLPENEQDVLMLFDSGNMAVGFWYDQDEWLTFWCAYTDDGFYTDCDCIPTHWMPLQEPPEVRG